MTRLRIPLVLAVLLLSVSSCAALFNSGTKGVVFTSEPNGAEVFINGQPYGRTPLSLKLKQKKDYVVMFRRSGFEERSYIVNNHVGAGWVILDVLGGLVPVIIDGATGAWYSLDDSSVHGVLAQSRVPSLTDSVVVDTSSTAQPNASPLGRQSATPGAPVAIIEGAPFTVRLEDGSMLPAKAVQPMANSELRVELTSGETRYVHAYKVKSIVGSDGLNWTRQVLEESKRLPRN